jgi:hypothetical protein
VQVLARGCDQAQCGHPDDAHQQVERMLEEACEGVRREFPKKAPCRCGFGYWAQHGPAYEMARHIGSDKLIGLAPNDCFSPN